MIYDIKLSRKTKIRRKNGEKKLDKIKIIIASHKRYQKPEEKMYMPVQVGAEGKEK